MPNLYKVQDHVRDLLGCSIASHTVGEYVFSSAYNSSFTLEFATSFFPSYVTTQEASVAPRVSTTRHVIQTNGLAFGLNPITRVKGA